MSRVDGVAFERFGAFKGSVQHYIGGGRRKAVDVDVHFHKAWDFAGKTFQTFLDTGLHSGLFGVGQLILQLPENNVLDHKKNPPAFFLIVAG